MRLPSSMDLFRLCLVLHVEKLSCFGWELTTRLTRLFVSVNALICLLVSFHLEIWYSTFWTNSIPPDTFSSVKNYQSLYFSSPAVSKTNGGNSSLFRLFY